MEAGRVVKGYAIHSGADLERANLEPANLTGGDGLVRSGIFEAKGGKARLLGRDELPADWDPTSDDRVRVCEVVQHLIKRLEDGDESEAAALRARAGSRRRRPRPSLPALLRVRAQEVGQGRAGLQLAGDELARVHPPGLGRARFADAGSDAVRARIRSEAGR